MSNWLSWLLCNIAIMFINSTTEELNGIWWELKVIQVDIVGFDGKIQEIKEKKSGWAKRLATANLERRFKDWVFWFEVNQWQRRDVNLFCLVQWEIEMLVNLYNNLISCEEGNYHVQKRYKINNLKKTSVKLPKN